MEKKVNLTIFFNYRNYSPRFKSILEDVFYKKMHDEKISSSDSMQQVMQFCNDVDLIEYGKIDEEKVLSRYTKNDRKIVINEGAINNLLEEHKDLDEEALLKNIFGRQVQNILTISDEQIFDITFEDILNKNGYVSPRRLADLAKDGETQTTESVINEIVGQKYIKSNVGSENIDNSTDEFELNRSTSNAKNDSFASFEESDTSIYENLDKPPKKYNSSDFEYDYDVVDCVRRKDDAEVGGAFSDFVNKTQMDVDYTLEDEENYGDLKKHKKNKSSNSFFAGMKNKMSSFKEKVKSLSKKDDNFDDYYNDFEKKDVSLEDNLEEADMSSYFGDFNYLDEKAKMQNQSNELFVKEKNNDAENSSNNELKGATTIVDNFDYSTSDIDVDKKFDSIIEAIMKEKRVNSYSKNDTEKAEDTSTKEELIDEESVDLKSNSEEKVDNSSIYDSFAEELETVESIRRRRRGK